MSIDFKIRVFIEPVFIIPNFSQILSFVREHALDDPHRLLLRQAAFPDVDIPLVAQQLEAQRQASAKWPTLARCPDFFFPPRLNREQSSSEAAARYKVAALHAQGLRVADLTGGMGVDSYFFSLSAASVDYVELSSELCAVAEYDFRALGASNIHCHQADCMTWIALQNQPFDLLYIDPARRDAQGRKVAAFECCAPDLLSHLDLLLSKGRRLVVKASPMIDISLAVRQLRCVRNLFAVAVKGECKELLFECAAGADEPLIHCVDIRHDATQEFLFAYGEESSAEGRFCDRVGHYLYEPHAALMKAGPYKLISERFNLEMLDRNTHLYTSDLLLPDFPGRIWSVSGELKLSKKEVAAALGEKRAHVVVRNYPVEAASLQKQLGLSEGGSRYILATTVKGKKQGFLCEEV